MPWNNALLKNNCWPFFPSSIFSRKFTKKLCREVYWTRWYRENLLQHPMSQSNPKKGFPPRQDGEHVLTKSDTPTSYTRTYRYRYGIYARIPPAPTVYSCALFRTNHSLIIESVWLNRILSYSFHASIGRSVSVCLEYTWKSRVFVKFGELEESVTYQPSWMKRTGKSCWRSWNNQATMYVRTVMLRWVRNIRRREVSELAGRLPDQTRVSWASRLVGSTLNLPVVSPRSSRQAKPKSSKLVAQHNFQKYKDL